MPGNFINTQLTLSGGSLIYVNCGRVYIGELTLTERPQLRNKRRDDYQMLGPANKKELHVKPKRVPLLNAVETVVTDEIGKSFVALQQSAKRFLDIPKEVENALSFKSLLVEAQEDDSFCDIVFHVSRLWKTYISLDHEYEELSDFHRSRTMFFPLISILCFPERLGYGSYAAARSMFIWNWRTCRRKCLSSY